MVLAKFKMRTVEQDVPVVAFIMLYKVGLTLKSAYKKTEYKEDQHTYLGWRKQTAPLKHTGSFVPVMPALF